MFLLYFLVFTLIFTIFENILLAGISLLLVFAGLLMYQKISKKKMLSWKMTLIILLSLTLSTFSFVVKEWRYYWVIHPTQTLPITLRGGGETIIWTGIISDISNQWKYIFNYEDNEYLLYSKKEYTIGDQIRIVWNLQKNIKNIWFSYRTISSWTFAIPLFSGSFDFNKWMKMKGRKGTIYEDNSIELQAWSLKPETVWLVKQMKKAIQEKVIEAYGKNRISWLILGMLIGDRSQIPESEYQGFINSGLVHLVAVSGGNILMIVVFLQCLLFFLPFYVRLGLILLTITGYGLICWLDSSVFRAVLMGGMNMVALFRGREINIWRLLSISCIIMLIINPYFLAYDTGFLLSYSAIIGIIAVTSDKWQATSKEKNWEKSDKADQNRIQKALQYIYKSYIQPSIWASIGIFPIIIFFMGKINILGIVWNLFVLPLVPFVMIYGFVSVWLHSWIGWERLLWIEKISVQYIYKISDLLSQYGIYFMVSWLRFKYVVLLVFVVFFVIWRSKSPQPSFVKGDQ